MKLLFLSGFPALFHCNQSDIVPLAGLNSSRPSGDSLTFRLNYFSLPLLFKVQSSGKRFYALGGIDAGFFMNH